MNDTTREFLRKKVDASGLSQVEIADRLKMTPSHISRLLSGERDTTLENLIAIADLLRIDRTYLLRLAAGLPAENEDDEWVTDTNNKIKLISPNLRNVAQRFIDSLLEGEEAPAAKASKPRKNGKHAAA